MVLCALVSCCLFISMGTCVGGDYSSRSGSLGISVCHSNQCATLCPMTHLLLFTLWKTPVPVPSLKCNTQIPSKTFWSIPFHTLSTKRCFRGDQLTPLSHSHLKHFSSGPSFHKGPLHGKTKQTNHPTSFLPALPKAPRLSSLTFGAKYSSGM